jgi:hypothetical protein
LTEGGHLNPENCLEVLRPHLLDSHCPVRHPHSLFRRLSSASDGRM